VPARSVGSATITELQTQCFEVIHLHKLISAQALQNIKNTAYRLASSKL
jgi:hypothetical protein